MSALKEDDIYQSNIPAGKILRRERDRYGQSLSDIESALRIKAEQIEALETSNFDALPGRVYALGFVRSYAEYLGLNPEKMVGLYRVEFEDHYGTQELHFPVAASDSKLPSSWLLVFAFVMCIVVMYFWWNKQPQNRLFVERIPKVGEVLDLEIVLDDDGEAAKVVQHSEGYTTRAAQEITPAMDIILNMRGNSWVEISDGYGKVLVSRVLKTGDRYFVPNRPDLTMSLGNAGVVVVEVAGKELGVLGDTGVVLRDLPLDAKLLKRRFRAHN